MSRRVMEMSLAVLETVRIADIDVLRMDIRVSWHLETVWTSAWLLELAYSLCWRDVEMLLAVSKTV